MINFEVHINKFLDFNFEYNLNVKISFKRSKQNRKTYEILLFFIKVLYSCI